MQICNAVELNSTAGPTRQQNQSTARTAREEKRRETDLRVALLGVGGESGKKMQGELRAVVKLTLPWIS